MNPDHIIDATGQEPIEMIISQEGLCLAVAAIGRLDERQEYIIRGYFNIGARQKTLEEIGQDLGISYQRVSQIRNIALEKMGFDPALRTHMPGR
jgi:DNA-directed RNA polymerase sigma subunit (sigma70/sigma32)